MEIAFAFVVFILMHCIILWIFDVHCNANRAPCSFFLFQIVIYFTWNTTMMMMMKSHFYFCPYFIVSLVKNNFIYDYSIYIYTTYLFSAILTPYKTHLFHIYSVWFIFNFIIFEWIIFHLFQDIYIWHGKWKEIYIYKQIEYIYLYLYKIGKRWTTYI